MTETKALVGVEVKDASRGQAIVKFAAYNEIDHHDDVTVKGAFQDGQKVVVSAYNHQSWGGRLPVGKGTIRNSPDGKSVLGELQFFMNTEAGRDTFETVKELGNLQQWSYGFDIPEGGAERGEFEGKSVRFLKEVNVHEISPVLVGAGKSTATLAVKSLEGDVEELYDVEELTEWLKAKPKPKPKPKDDDDDKKKPGDKKPSDDDKKPAGDSKKPKDDDEEEEDDDDKKKPRRKKPGESGKMRMSDHCLEVLTSVKELADRAEEIVALRKADGKKGLAPETQVLLDLVGDQLKRLESLANSDDPVSLDGALMARALKNLSEEL